MQCSSLLVRRFSNTVQIQIQCSVDRCLFSRASNRLICCFCFANSAKFVRDSIIVLFTSVSCVVGSDNKILLVTENALDFWSDIVGDSLGLVRNNNLFFWDALIG